MKLCIIGNRGHNGYVLEGLAQMEHICLAAASSGTAEDDPEELRAWCAKHGHTPAAIGDYRAMLDHLVNARKSYRLGQRPSYYTRRETYGGTIPWVGSHAIDWVHWFSGQAFVSVCASHATRHNRGLGDLEVSALCQFVLTDEVLASVSIDYSRPPNALAHGDDRVRVVGTEGAIEVHGGAVFLINDEAEGEQRLRAACDRQIFRDFVEHVKGKATALLEAEETFAVTEACLLARQSADEGRIVKFGSWDGMR